jgi:hypothetical protein
MPISRAWLPDSISDGRRGALLVLPAVIVDFGIYWIQLGLPDRGGRIDRVDYVVLPIFPGRRCAHANDWRRPRGRLHISLHHIAPAGLRAAHGCNRALHCARDRNVRDAKSRLVRARCGISITIDDWEQNFRFLRISVAEGADLGSF